MISREDLAARIYADHYIRPSNRGRWKYYVSPKQCFRAADHFLKEAEHQRGLDVVPSKPSEPTVAKDAEVECEHKWPTQALYGDMRCKKCSASKVVEKKPLEFWIDFNCEGKPMYAWNEKPIFQPANPYQAKLFREILD